MAVIFFLIVIVLIIVIFYNNSQYKKLYVEKLKLEEKVKYIEKQMKTKQEEKCIANDNNNETEELQKDNTIKAYIEDKKYEEIKNNTKKKDIENKKSLSEIERKNILLLTVGAICIVLSAIVFLVSTWSSIPNLLKTTVLVLLTLVFFGGSYISKRKFKLDKSSKAFFYIAMAYIPICLISISIFGLINTYFSINGEGRYIYLGISALFIAILYYLTYSRSNNKFLLYGSILSQVFTVVLFSLVFENNILLIEINLLIYNIMLMIFTRKNIFEKLYTLIAFVIAVIGIFNLIQENIYVLYIALLLGINFLILELKDTKNLYAYMFNICLNISGIYALFLFNIYLKVEIYHMLVVACPIFIYIGENIILSKSKKTYLKKSLNALTIIILFILHILSCFNYIIVAPYVIAVLQLLLLISIYIKEKNDEKWKDITSTLIPLYLIILGLNIMFKFELSYHYYIVFALIIFIIGEVFRRIDKKIHLSFFILSNLWIIITYLTVTLLNYNEVNNDLIYAILLFAVYIYNWKVEKKLIFKYSTYFVSNIVLFTGCKKLGLDSIFVPYIPAITSIIIIVIENIWHNLKDDNSNIYLAVSQLISFGFLYDSNNEIRITISVLFACILIIYNILSKNNKLNIIPMVSIIPAVFRNDLDMVLKLTMMFGVLGISSTFSLKNKKISIYTIFSAIYLIFTIMNINNIYIKEIFISVWLLLHTIFIKEEKIADKFKLVFYLSILTIYNEIINDLEINTYTAIRMLGYIAVEILITRTILKKYVKDIDKLEYLLTGGIYLMSIPMYNNEIDGIIYGALIVSIIILSYIKKYGAIFITSIVAILINIFLLTRKFWFSMPWWIYLLGVGIIMLVFATKNEIKEKKENKNIGSILNVIKERLEKKE